MLEVHNHSKEMSEIFGIDTLSKKMGQKGKSIAARSKQYFVRVVFLPDQASHLSLSRFLTQGQLDNLYNPQNPNCSLSAPVAVLDIGGEKANTEKLAEVLREKLTVNEGLISQQISSFVPISTVYPDVSTGFIFALFKNDFLFQFYNQKVFEVAGNDLAASKGSFLPEFDPLVFRPFMCVGRVNNCLREQTKISQILTETLHFNPQKVTFRAFSCDVFHFDFERYFASVDLEAFLKKNAPPVEPFLQARE